MVWILYFSGSGGHRTQELLRYLKMASVYQINKGINKPIVFKGLRAQYIAYLAIGMVALLLSFVVLYLLSMPLIVLVPLIVLLALLLIYTVQQLSKCFGQHGLMKYTAARTLPATLRIPSRKVFTSLIKNSHAKL